MGIKNYYLHVLSFVILLMLAVISIKSYINWDKDMRERSSEVYEKYCLNEIDEPKEEFCKSLHQEVQQKRTFFPMLSATLREYYIPNGVIMTLFILLPSCYYITKYLKNRIILNENNRLKYTKSIIKVFKNSYLTALIFPVILIIIFTICYIYTGTFELKSFEINNIPWPYDKIESPILFLILYILNFILIGLSYINCTLTISRKYHNYFISTILSFITLLGIELFFEIIINSLICSKILHSDIGMIFNIINPLAFNITYGFVPTIIFSLIICLLSFIPVIIIYKNKEKLIIDCEKNS